MKKIIETKIQKRFADVDIFGHVNNVHQQEYLDVGKTDYYRSVLELDALADAPTLMIVSVKTDFSGQVRFEDEVSVRTWVESVGTKSITLGQQIVIRRVSADSSGLSCASVPAATEKICTESRSVLVCFDRGSQQTLAVPDEWRARIENGKGSDL